MRHATFKRSLGLTSVLLGFALCPHTGGTAAPVVSEHGVKLEVSQGGTLWHVIRGRIPQGATFQQVMVAYFRSNPEAFEGGSLFLLRTGASLNVPTEEAIFAEPAASASAIYQQHEYAWRTRSNAVKLYELTAAPPNLAERQPAPAVASSIVEPSPSPGVYSAPRSPGVKSNPDDQSLSGWFWFSAFALTLLGALLALKPLARSKPIDQLRSSGTTSLENKAENSAIGESVSDGSLDRAAQSNSTSTGTHWESITADPKASTQSSVQHTRKLVEALGHARTRKNAPQKVVAALVEGLEELGRSEEAERVRLEN